jgi:integrase
LEIFAKVTSIKAPEVKTTLREALKLYEDDYVRRNRKSSFKRTIPEVRAFAEFVGLQTPLSDIKRTHLVEFHKKRGETCSPWTANNDLVRAKGFINFLRAEGLVLGDPTLKIRRFKTPTVAKEAMTPEVARTVLRVMEGHPWLHDYIRVLAETGMRPQEGLNVRGYDLDTTNRTIHVRAWGSFQVKDAEDRKLCLNDTALEVLSRRKLQVGNDAIPLFTTNKGTARNILDTYHRYKTRLRKAVEYRRAPTSVADATLYSWRHYFATRCVAEGWPVDKLAQYLGHATAATTLRFYADRRVMEIGAPPSTTTCRKEAQAQ